MELDKLVLTLGVVSSLETLFARADQARYITKYLAGTVQQIGKLD